MSSTTLDSTGAGSLPLVSSLPAWDQKTVARSWTLLTAVGIPEEVSATLDSWGSTIVMPHVSVPSFPRNEVEAVEFIVDALELSQVAVLKALRIPKRTFFGWKGKGHRPRQPVKDRVWTMTNAVAGLAATHDNLAAWFHANDKAQQAFKSGDPAALALVDFQWASLNQQVQVPPVISFDAAESVPYATGTVSGNASVDLASFLAVQPEIRS